MRKGCGGPEKGIAGRGETRDSPSMRWDTMPLLRECRRPRENDGVEQAALGGEKLRTLLKDAL